MISLDDFEKYARDNLPKKVFNYVSNGAADQQTLHDNRNAFKRLRIRPRVLRDVSKRDLSATILGQHVPFPIGICPTAIQKLSGSDGETATARAASSMGTIMILSTYATCSIEEVAHAAPTGHLWLQMYLFTDRKLTADLIHRAERAGYKAIVVTIDSPIAGNRLNDERYGGFNPAVRIPNVEGSSYRPVSGSVQPAYGPDELSESLTWSDIRWVKTLSSLPVIVKGILSGDAAREALAAGVDGILVSNHGGRQLDGVPASIDALAEVIAVTQGTNVEVYLDGGVRLGTDVLKALALGARAVFIGRPVWWGLTYKGEEGVRKVLELLRDELSLAMALSGCSSVGDLGPSMLTRGPSSNL
ncbi:2-Hydroxyacid oxidase 1-like isoform X2 [Asterias amurensis]|uniref:2-Hydroxyacid oxidase 1-like isoform X2 n=1 Tax=Asterias amurensis TaxID=7602 RepID=UPI003AB45C36